MTDETVGPKESGTAAASEEQARTIRNDEGVPIARYEYELRGERPWADELSLCAGVVADARVVASVVAELAGWGATATSEIAGPLIAGGAHPVRVFHTYTMDLTASPIAAPDLRPGLRAIPAQDLPAAALHPALSAAYPPSHPDFDSEAFAALDGLYDGSLMGPLLPCSTAILEGEKAVAAALVNASESDGPWLSEIFRAPGAELAGLGSTLLQMVIADASSAGLPTLGLAVTESNPARTLYERLGFRHTETWTTLIFPNSGE
ncbi:GNAT family N-acetyltransferase [Nocardia jejuensis]|uniref:GNAT family N-acetyltransferase n=1 Tax=Nocardia jejuensis TaxID=328049 RepID=UPI001471852D|nr:GNAT family N-acetyltransferase [Nocardia jejuensis]